MIHVIGSKLKNCTTLVVLISMRLSAITDNQCKQFIVFCQG